MINKNVNEILINVTPQETRVAVMEQGVVQEIHIERTTQLGVVSNVYRGEVVRVLQVCNQPLSKSVLVVRRFCMWLM